MEGIALEDQNPITLVILMGWINTFLIIIYYLVNIFTQQYRHVNITLNQNTVFSVCKKLRETNVDQNKKKIDQTKNKIDVKI